MFLQAGFVKMIAVKHVPRQMPRTEDPLTKVHLAFTCNDERGHARRAGLARHVEVERMNPPFSSIKTVRRYAQLQWQ